MTFNVGIIAEGPTDVAVIENVIAGITNAVDNNFTYLKPETVSGTIDPHKISNWSQVLAYCESPEFRDLILSDDYVDFVVIQIDTDQFDPVHFNIPTHDDGAAISAARKYELASNIIIRRIGTELFGTLRAKIVFAVCIDTIECWLLPLYFPSATAKRSKTTGCFETLRSHKIARRVVKSYAWYQFVSAPYSKQEAAITFAEHNFSLGEFVANVHVVLSQWLPQEEIA